MLLMSCVLCRVRIVGNHHHRLLQFAIERSQDLENLFTRTRVQVPGWLISQNQIRIGDYCARDRNALFLAARQLAWLVIHAVGESHELQRRSHVPAPLSL